MISPPGPVSISLVSFGHEQLCQCGRQRKYRVSEEKRRQILQAARELTTALDAAARMPRGRPFAGHRRVLSDISNIFYEIARRARVTSPTSGAIPC